MSIPAIPTIPDSSSSTSFNAAIAPTFQPVPAPVSSPAAADATPSALPSEADISRARALLDEAMNVNLDEVTAETLSVAIVEYKPETTTDEAGVTHNAMRRYVRHAQIDTFVPLRIFNEMVRRRDEARKKGPDAQLAMIIDMVLKVWQLSEPDMTQDRLIDGLGWKKVQGLFGHFFKDEL